MPTVPAADAQALADQQLNYGTRPLDDPRCRVVTNGRPLRLADRVLCPNVATCYIEVDSYEVGVVIDGMFYTGSGYFRVCDVHDAEARTLPGFRLSRPLASGREV